MKKNKTLDPRIVDKVTEKDFSLARYYGAIPNILLFEVVTKIILVITTKLLSLLISTLVDSSGIGALTNMDLPFLFRSWRGILILILGFVILCLYTVFDINTIILISDNVLHKKEQSIFTILKKAISSIRLMIHPKALFMLLFVVLIAPLTVSFYGVSLTESFYIPDFIISVIHKNPLYNIPYTIFLIAMGIFGFLYLFTFQFMILRQENISTAMWSSRLTMQKHWKNFIKRYSLFIVKFLAFVVLFIVIFVLFIPYFVNAICPEELKRFLTVFAALQGWSILKLIILLFTPFQIMELNRIYESYTTEDEGEFIRPKKSYHVSFWLLVLGAYALLAIVSFGISYEDNFDYFFPLNTPSEIVAHRAGGSLGNENTIVGLKAAKKKNVYGSEIDIQRTKDGHYIVNHDDDFSRVCDVDKTPGELTLAECKKLKVKDTFRLNGKPTEVATFEEFLDEIKGSGVTLYIELKGVSADSQMVEDAYRMIKERDMVDEVVVISLYYDLIYEMEEKHPEITTGYLCFVSLGDVEKLKCDQLLLEDEMATETVIDAAHEANKKVFIWTVNSEETIKRRMLDESDGIITDEVEEAIRMYNILGKRDDVARIMDAIIDFL